MTSYTNASVVAGMSRLTSVIGVWRKKPDMVPTASSDEIEIDARHEIPPPNFSLPMRPPAIHTTYQDQRGTLYSLDTCRLSGETLSVPPPYSPTGYTCTATEKHTEVPSDEEPPTLARMLFLYGFFFFPFWLAGICILRSPLLPTPDWEAGKTEEERAQLLQLLRKTELKWAHRCLYALFGLLLAVFFLVVIIKFGILKTL